MPRVSWQNQAKADLEGIPSTVRDQLRRNAEKILHDIPPHTCPPVDEGAYGEIMWHRGETSEEAAEHADDPGDGPHNYFLFYKKKNSPPGFEILAVRSIHQAASMWAQMSMEQYGPTGAPPP